MIAATIQQLQGKRPPFAIVEGVARFAAIRAEPPAWPAAYVLPLAETASPNARATGGHLQQVSISIAVVIICRAVQDPSGAAAVTDLAALRLATQDALLGWTPEGAASGYDYSGGELLRAEAGTIWWQDTYTASYYLQP